MKATSIRLTADQERALERLAPVLAKARPELAALAGGALTLYATLRVALSIGIQELEKQVGLEPL